ncbi:MAG: cyclase family protein [Candidatus Brocadiia bacterium]|jgi:arylformamidase
MENAFLDVSVPIVTGMAHWPSDPPVSVELYKFPEKGDRSTVSLLRMGSHTGTHMDAPRHFLPGSAGVDETPLEFLIGPYQVADCRGLKSISLRQVTGLDVPAAPRVLFRTDNSERVASRNEFFTDYVAVETSAAKWLVEQGAVLIGVDGLSIDPYHAPNPGAHLAVLEAGKVVVEGLCLAGIEAGRYELICLPLRIKGCDGSPVRALLRRP